MKHLLSYGCGVLREGGNHTSVFNPANKKQTIVGRHREIDNSMARTICKQLGIPAIR